MPDLSPYDQAEFEAWLDTQDEFIDWLPSTIDELNRSLLLPDNYSIPF